MRKDVKLGLAVGGVLLAVLVVYVLVVPGNSGSQPGADVALSDPQDLTGGATAQGGTGATDSTASAGRDAAKSTHADQHDTASASKDDAKGATGSDSAKAGTSSDSSATGGASGTASDGADTTKNSGEKPSADTGGGWNWDALVNGTEKVPSLGAATDVPTNGGPIASNTGGASGSLASAGAHGTGAEVTPPSLNNEPKTGSSHASGSTAGNDTASQGTRLAPSAKTEAHASTGAQTYVVKSGDTYSKISQAIYGTSKHYLQIEEANPNVDATRLKPGMTINLPAVDSGKSSSAASPTGGAITAAATEKALDPKTQYKVQANDNLYSISLKLYGKADRVEKIYEANKATIGDDMAKLKVGTVLNLPEAPTQSNTSSSSISGATAAR